MTSEFVYIKPISLHSVRCCWQRDQAAAYPP